MATQPRSPGDVPAPASENPVGDSVQAPRSGAPSPDGERDVGIGPGALGLLALQRAAGNAAVARLVADARSAGADARRPPASTAGAGQGSTTSHTGRAGGESRPPSAPGLGAPRSSGGPAPLGGASGGVGPIGIAPGYDETGGLPGSTDEVRSAHHGADDATGSGDAPPVDDGGAGTENALVARLLTDAAVQPAPTRGTAGTLRLQRDNGQGGAPPSDGGQGGGPAQKRHPDGAPQPAEATDDPDVAQKVAYAESVLARVPRLDEGQTGRLNACIGDAAIYGLIVQKRDKAHRITVMNDAIKNNGSVDGMSATQMAAEGERLAKEVEELDAQIKAILPTMGVSDEQEIVDRVERAFPELWIGRAKQIALSMLDENRAKVWAELQRYKSQVSSEEIGPAAAKGLREADAKLLPVYDQIVPLGKDLESIVNRIQETESQGSEEQKERLSGDVQRRDELRAELAPLLADLQRELQAQAARYPVLLAEGYKPGQYQGLTDEQIEESTGAQLEEILENIDETKENIQDEDIKVWDLHHVKAMTFQSLGVAMDSPLAVAVERFAAGKRSNEKALEIAIASFQAAVTILAFAAGGPLAATAVSMGLGVLSLVRNISKFMAEESAQYAGLDPAIRDISEKRPELMPIVMDLLMLGLDAATVVRAAPEIKTALQEAFAARGAAEAAEDAFVKRVASVGVGEDMARQLYKTRAAKMAATTVTPEAVAAAAAAGRAGPLNAKMVSDRIGEMVEGAVPRLAKKLLGSGRAVMFDPANPATVAALERIRPGFAKEVADDFAKGYSGMYYGGPGYGLIVYAPSASVDAVASNVVHEAVHRLQEMAHGATKDAADAYVREFQAFSAQSDYITLAHRSGAYIPPDYEWMIDATHEAIDVHIMAHYRDAILPKGFDPEKAIEEVFHMMKYVPAK